MVSVDTSILCVLLKVPGKDTCGSGAQKWHHENVADRFSAKAKSSPTFVMPLAAIIETGNHIAQCPGNRYEISTNFCSLLKKVAEATTPWAAFTDQYSLWTNAGLLKLAKEWPEKAAAKLSIGDATIKDVADYYASAGFEVEIFTGDEGLKSYEPAKPILIPRRRK